MRRLLVLSVLAVVFGSTLVPTQAQAEDPPIPEPDILGRLPVAKPCTAKAGNPYEVQQYQDEGWGTGPRYGSDCKRLRFAFGPIHTKPGQNDVLIEPVTIQKPAFDGYVVRFEPNLVDATGKIPGVHEIHLHHAVWLHLLPNNPFLPGNYGNGMNPFFGVGEEKTILNLPAGNTPTTQDQRFGLPVRATDTWQILYMIHNQFPAPTELWITYEIDIIPKAVAEKPVTQGGWGIKPVYPIWLDVRPSFYPVFNTKRNFGEAGKCTWPTQNCADHDPWGQQTCNQGDTTCSPSDFDNTFRLPDAGGGFGRVTNFQDGTLVHIAGHLHPGGLTVEVDLERSGQTPRRIFTSEGIYWNHEDHDLRTGPPTSWDMSMTAAGLPKWGVRVQPRDRFRITATYDVSEQSTYENMGIVVAWIAPSAPSTLGLDPFTSEVDTGSGCPSGGLLASPAKLCVKGEATHGHLAEAEVYGGANVVGLPSDLPPGPRVPQITISSFGFFPGGFGGSHGTLALTGIPRVVLGQDPTLRFVNADAPEDIYHSVTSCAYPCTGTSGIAYPLSNGLSSTNDAIDFDSGELGFGPALGNERIGPAKNRADWTLAVDANNGFAEGTYTYFCRVHPFMRGAFAVEEPDS